MQDTENIENLEIYQQPYLKIHFHSFLRNTVLKSITKNLSHTHLHKAYKHKMEIEENSNSKYQKKELDVETSQDLEKQLNHAVDNIMKEIEQFNDQIKLDDSFYNRLFKLREEKVQMADYRDKSTEIIETMNQSYKHFENLKLNKE